MSEICNAEAKQKDMPKEVNNHVAIVAAYTLRSITNQSGAMIWLICGSRHRNQTAKKKKCIINNALS